MLDTLTIGLTQPHADLNHGAQRINMKRIDYKTLPYMRLMLFGIENKIYTAVMILGAAPFWFIVKGWSGLLMVIVPFLASQLVILLINESPLFHDAINRYYHRNVIGLELKLIMATSSVDDHAHEKFCAAYREIFRLQYLLNDTGFTVPASGIADAELDYVNQIQFNYLTLWFAHQEMQSYLKVRLADRDKPEDGSSLPKLKPIDPLAAHLTRHIQAVEERMQSISEAVAQTCQDLQNSNEDGSWRTLRDRIKQLASENVWPTIESSTARRIYESRLEHIGIVSREVRPSESRLRLAFVSFVLSLTQRRRCKARERDLQRLLNVVSKRAPDDAARHATVNAFGHLEESMVRAARQPSTTGIGSRKVESVAQARVNYLTLWLAELMMRDKAAASQDPHATGSGDDRLNLDERAALERNISGIQDWLRLAGFALTDCDHATEVLWRQPDANPGREQLQPLHDIVDAVTSLGNASSLIHGDVFKYIRQMRRKPMDSKA